MYILSLLVFVILLIVVIVLYKRNSDMKKELETKEDALFDFSDRINKLTKRSKDLQEENLHLYNELKQYQIKVEEYEIKTNKAKDTTKKSTAKTTTKNTTKKTTAKKTTAKTTAKKTTKKGEDK